MRKMSDDLRIKEVESLLDRYYKSEDSFEQTDLAISIIQGHVGYLLNGFKQNQHYREAIKKGINATRYTNPEVAYILAEALEDEE